MSDESVLICRRVSEFPGGPPAESYIDTCRTCGAAVWHAHSSPNANRIICLRCVKPELERVRASGEPVEIMPPTAEQLRDAQTYFEELDDHD